MPLTGEDRAVMEHLANVGALYDRYLEIAKVAQIPSRREQESLGLDVPPRTDLPLILEVHRER